MCAYLHVACIPLHLTRVNLLKTRCSAHMHVADRCSCGRRMWTKCLRALKSVPSVTRYVQEEEEEEEEEDG